MSTLKRIEKFVAEWHETTDTHLVFSLINDADRVLFDADMSLGDLRAVLQLAREAAELKRRVRLLAEHLADFHPMIRVNDITADLLDLRKPLPKAKRK